MHRIPTLWKANAIVFISSFCVMVIELIAGRMLAPYIGVSLYTWTSIIGVILAGIALGNYLGGKVADKFTSPLVLAIIIFAGSLATLAILPSIKFIGPAGWFGEMPLMLDFLLKVLCIFFPPAIILSMVTPMVIKLTLSDLGKTGGVVGAIYAFSTAGAILGTFMTGFYFILWFGTRSIVWLVVAILIFTGVIAWFSWKVPNRWSMSFRNLKLWLTTAGVIIISLVFSQFRGLWDESFTKESNYYTIQVETQDDEKVLILDYMVHGRVVLDDPTDLRLNHIRIFAEMLSYLAIENSAPYVLHLGGGSYSFSRYMEEIYPESINEV
ncbi:fused MFS/spermidine synthase, partial [Chloroflexota bacterium]